MFACVAPTAAPLRGGGNSGRVSLYLLLVLNQQAVR